MFSVSVAFGPVSWLLMFREKANAEATIKSFTTPFSLTNGFGTEKPNAVTDDFGQSVHWMSPPTAIMLEDMEASKLMHIEHQMRGVHIQTEVRKRAENDSQLRMGRGGPAIMTPFAPNGRMP